MNFQIREYIGKLLIPTAETLVVYYRGSGIAPY